MGLLSSRGLWPRRGLGVSPLGTIVVWPLPLGGGPVTQAQASGLVCLAMKGWCGTLIPFLSALLTPKGFGVVQANPHEAFSHGRIVSGCRGDLRHHGLQASPKQTLVAKGDSVGILCQYISLVALGTGSHLEG